MNKRAQLYALLALFFGPLVVAWIWFFHFEGVRPGTVNKGELITPVIALGDLGLDAREEGVAANPFTEDWSIVVLAPRACDEHCEQALYVTRQVWIRLNKDADRVQRVMLASPGVDYPADAHRDLKAYDADAATFARFTGASGGDGRVYLVDPQGNLMMRYPPDFTPEMLHDDLKRLLRYSDAG